MGTTGKGSGTASASSGKALSALKTICEYHGWSDMTTTGTAELTNFINFTIDILCTLAPWPEYHRIDGSHTFDADDDSETLDESNIERVGTVVHSTLSHPLSEWTLEDWRFNKTYHAGTGTPTHYALRKYVSSGDYAIDMHLYPCPVAETIVYYTYAIAPNTLVEDSDTTDWPTKRLWLLMEALKTRLAAIDKDPSGVALYGSGFMDKVNRAFNQSRPSYMPVIAKPFEVVKPGKWHLTDIEKSFS